VNLIYLLVHLNYFSYYLFFICELFLIYCIDHELMNYFYWNFHFIHGILLWILLSLFHILFLLRLLFHLFLYTLNEFQISFTNCFVLLLRFLLVLLSLLSRKYVLIQCDLLLCLNCTTLFHVNHSKFLSIILIIIRIYFSIILQILLFLLTSVLTHYHNILFIQKSLILKLLFILYLNQLHN
jgi:hypothetical protein